MAKERSGKLLTAALLRPVNLLAPGLGLLLALTLAPWWLFPLSFVPYAIMVLLSLRDPKFVQRALHVDAEEQAGEEIEWGHAWKELGNGPWTQPLQRIGQSERAMTGQLAQTPEAARPILASTLAQVRSAARLAIDLARKLKALDASFMGFAAMNPQNSRAEADEKRRRAAAVHDEQARASLLEAATSLDEAAKSAEGTLRLRERTLAQLENLAASLDSVTVRSVRLRVTSDGMDDLASGLNTDIDAVKETLAVFEADDGVASAREQDEGAAPKAR
jgi:hypothetical protein